jgi:osmoprotectant transport system permease protein
MGVLGDAFAWLTDPVNYAGEQGIPVRLYEHLLMSSQTVLFAALIALPIGMYIGHRRRFEFIAVNVGNLGRALPSFGILGLVFPFTLTLPGEIGFWATFIALFLLAIPPILTNTYVGVKNVDADVVESARGMGMGERGVLFRLESPLAAPLIVAGLRTAAVQVVATATLGAVAGWGGLGRFIVDGNSQGDDAQLLGGAILVALFAIATEVSFALLERWVAPKESSTQGRFSLRRSGGTTASEPPLI